MNLNDWPRRRSKSATLSPMTSIACKKKLLILTSTYPRWAGDPEPGFVHELATRLVSTFSVHVLGPHAQGAKIAETRDGVHIRRYRYAPSKLETLINDGGIVSNLRNDRWKLILIPGFFLALVWRTWRLIVSERPDVIHAHWLLPQGLAVALISMFDKRAPPFLVTSHGADLFSLRSWPFPALKRFVMRRTSAATVVSDAMCEELSLIGADTSRVAVQPMGVDLSKAFAPIAEATRSGVEILFVGRLVEKKGLRFLIDAMPAILARHPDSFLNVVGFGPEEPALRRRVTAQGLEGKIHFLGPVPNCELPKLYQRAAVFVAPFIQASDGDQEGLGLVVVEALGCGCPVVVTDLPATRQVFAGRNIAERTVPGCSVSLAQSVSSVLSNQPTVRQRVAGFNADLRTQFDWQHVGSRYSALLMRLTE